MPSKIVVAVVQFATYAVFSVRYRINEFYRKANVQQATPDENKVCCGKQITTYLNANSFV